jgi:hypothetical protein
LAPAQGRDPLCRGQARYGGAMTQGEGPLGLGSTPQFVLHSHCLTSTRSFD